MVVVVVTDVSSVAGFDEGVVPASGVGFTVGLGVAEADGLGVAVEATGVGAGLAGSSDGAGVAVGANDVVGVGVADGAALAEGSGSFFSPQAVSVRTASARNSTSSFFIFNPPSGPRPAIFPPASERC